MLEDGSDMVGTWWIWALVLVGLLLGGGMYRAWVRRRVRRRTVLEDALKVLLDCTARGAPCGAETLAARLGLSLSTALTLAQELARRGLVQVQDARLILTPQGRALALHILRAHRLWERYLSDYTDLPLAEVHRRADRMEHRLSPQDVRRLAAALGHPRRDPHGDPIPPEDGELRAPGTPLSGWPVGKPARIVHIEDEPVSILEQILAEDLLPGTRVKVLETSPQGVHLKVLDEDREVWLAGVVASHIHVAPLKEHEEQRAKSVMTLAQAPLRQRVRVVGLSPRLRGLLRRRLLDLGFTPGAVIEPVMESAFGRGDPRAYRVRGTVIALRREQAEHILVEPVAKADEAGTKAPESVAVASTKPSEGHHA